MSVALGRHPLNRECMQRASADASAIDGADGGSSADYKKNNAIAGDTLAYAGGAQNRPGQQALANAGANNAAKVSSNVLDFSANKAQLEASIHKNTTRTVFQILSSRYQAVSTKGLIIPRDDL